jgi:hypothetical protein
MAATSWVWAAAGVGTLFLAAGLVLHIWMVRSERGDR